MTAPQRQAGVSEESNFGWPLPIPRSDWVQLWIWVFNIRSRRIKQ